MLVFLMPLLLSTDNPFLQYNAFVADQEGEQIAHLDPHQEEHIRNTETQEDQGTSTGAQETVGLNQDCGWDKNRKKQQRVRKQHRSKTTNSAKEGCSWRDTGKAVQMGCK